MLCVQSLRFLILVAAFAIAGCASSDNSSKVNYETVARDPRRDTERAEAENARAKRLIAAGDYARAETALRAALSADVMHGPAHNNLGKVYYHERRYYLAAWEFQYASKLMPNQPEPRNNLGLVYEAVGKLKDAAACYTNAHELDPDNPQFIGNLARSRIRQGERSAELRTLLENLVLRETRRDWSQWAQEQTALMPAAGTPTSTGVTTQP